MRIIEFFGVPCSGKTFFHKSVVNKIDKNQKIFSYKSVIFKFVERELELSKIDKLSILYFKLIKLKKKKSKDKKNLNFEVKTNYIKRTNIKDSVFKIFFKRYKIICNKIFLKYKKKKHQFC